MRCNVPDYAHSNVSLTIWQTLFDVLVNEGKPYVDMVSPTPRDFLH